MQTENRVLHTRNLTVGFKEKGDEGTIFKDISVTAGRSELVALFGSNGIGKSTLLRSLVRLQKPVSGEIYLGEKNIDTLSGNELARQVGFVSTEIVNVNNLRVYDLVSLGRYPYTGWMGKLGSNDIARVEEAIEMVGITSLRYKSISRLSDGERQRAMIARTLAQDTMVIVLDEPTAFLDLPNKYEVVHLLHKLATSQGRTVVFSTHDLNIAIREADKIWLMLPGEMIQGAPEDLILDGSFGKMFNQTSLLFDTGSGEFRIRRNAGAQIGLRGPDREVKWTANAIGRMGLGYGDEGSLKETIEIRKKKQGTEWVHYSAGNAKAFDSIYELCKFLRGHHKDN